MATLLVFHEVDDVDRWLASTNRADFFGPRGISTRAFRDPAGSNRVALLVETPDVEAWEASLKEPEAAEAMRADGVRPETIVTLVGG